MMRSGGSTCFNAAALFGFCPEAGRAISSRPRAPFGPRDDDPGAGSWRILRDRGVRASETRQSDDLSRLHSPLLRLQHLFSLKTIRLRACAVHRSSIPPRSRGAIDSLPERLRQERQADVIPIVDIGVRVVELTVHVRDAPVPELLVQDPGAPDQVVLVLRPAVDVDEPQATEPRGVPIDHIDGIPAPPSGPHLGPPFAGLQVEGEVNSELLALRIWRIVCGHADRVQHGLHFAQAAIRLPPEPWKPFRGTVLLPKSRERLWAIRDVAEVDEGAARAVRDGRPGVRMKHPLDNGSVSAGGLAPDPPPGDAVHRLDQRDALLADVGVLP